MEKLLFFLSSSNSSFHFRLLFFQLSLSKRRAWTVFEATNLIGSNTEEKKLKTDHWVFALSWRYSLLRTNVSLIWSLLKSKMCNGFRHRCILLGRTKKLFRKPGGSCHSWSNFITVTDSFNQNISTKLKNQTKPHHC